MIYKEKKPKISASFIIKTDKPKGTLLPPFAYYGNSK